MFLSYVSVFCMKRHYFVKSYKICNWTSCKVGYILKNLSHYTTRRRLGGRYSSYSFSTSALDCVSGQRLALAPGKGPPEPPRQEAGWAPEPVWTQRLEEKSFRLCRGSNLDRPVVQPVTRHYTDWATRLTWYTLTRSTNENPYHRTILCVHSQ
jgi:hypothetical protein